MALQGGVEDIQLENLVQIICMEKRTAVLKLDRKGEQGLIYFTDGNVVHALSSKYKVGPEAFYHILTWSKGTFLLQQGVPSPRKSIELTCAKLLTNAFERIDSKNAEKGKLKQKDFSQQEIETDSSLENDLIVLISSLEHTQSRICEHGRGLKPEQVVDLLTGMVNEIAANVEKYKDLIVESDPLGIFLTLIGHNCPAARYLKVRANRITTDSCMALYKVLKNDKNAQQQFVEEIIESLLYVMGANYEHLLSSFNDSENIPQWSDAGKEFFTDVRQSLEIET